MGDALDRLIEAVEAGEATRAQMEDLAALALGLSVTSMNVAAAYAADDMNAAKALHEALLPRWGWMVADKRSACVIPTDADRANGISGETGISEGNPARAWLLAILRAYRAQVPHA
jgi:hypothetical protein